MKYLYVRHVLDVMHIKKNICIDIVGTLFSIKRQSKNGLELIGILDIEYTK